MKQFYQPVDIRSRKAMTDFLSHHFRYNTMNSWNQSTSYACNLKIDRLGLDFEIINKLFDMIDTQEFYYAQQELRDAFGAAHDYRWQVRMNGRSGGYLVLYQGDRRPSQYKSFCICCGQKNYTSVSETGTQCGACHRETRIDYDVPPAEITVYPYQSTDDGEDYEEWSMYQLKERVRLVQELDRLADALVQQAVTMAQNYSVAEEEYYLPQTRKVLVAST